ncbi:Extracellular exo-inulinase inuE [Aspergillus welwitschiae]|uniref:Extracellular exo-inulinase inuE n=1 Tax=Aspergillus welwitschiae TaxID=1341132 RepID=A0A3F3PII0_9EURO|nr:Extracellular exo-inulinase inuE [Aspergillus welwitschiae]RDH26745.1 Extracellular exo-inulinase inuE [Aspergillus welwitschiae]
MAHLPKVLAVCILAGIAYAFNYDQPYRGQYHFSPLENWMNDPNGLLYHNGIYHLFFQYNPGGIQWGNLSWGHATSRDLTHWEEQPIALLARGYGGNNITEMYFSGSAVADVNNTSGFGKNGKAPIVAMYTSYYPVTQTLPSGQTVQEGQQAQSIAYSLDDGMTWTTYDAANPVITNPPEPYQAQYQNFRDPFVFWHEESQKWVVIISLAALHKLAFYTSDNLKDWKLVSEFGPYNAQDGVWECPGLFKLPIDGGNSTKWVLTSGLNPGGPPGTVGSGTQYFVGEFDGNTFTPNDDTVYPGNSTANWMDWGPDFYAAAGYNGLSLNDHVHIGWMNNWQYGANIPTYPWRSAMAIPRHLALKTICGKATLVQQPQEAWSSILSKNPVYSRTYNTVPVGSTNVSTTGEMVKIDLSFSAASTASSFAIALRASADFSEQTLVGYDFVNKQLFLDRTKSGDVSFDQTFASVYRGPLTPDNTGMVSLSIFVDRSSVEVFGGQGEATLTAQIFPSNDAVHARLLSTGGATKNVYLDIYNVTSTWN